MNSFPLTRVATVILGLLYLASGISKAMDINAFADVIVNYGIPPLRMFAPLVIGLEITLGFGLLFEVYRQRTGLLSLRLLILFTLIFTFGYIFLGISDCGCFGEVLSMPPAISLLRNTFMIAMSYYIWKQPEKQVSLTVLKTTFAVVMGTVTFATTGFEMKKTYIEISVHEGSNLSKTFLRPLIDPNKDQLIFIFSPSCTHCQRVTPKINSYAETETVDEIVGVYSNSVSSESLPEYKKKSAPVFRIVSMNKESLRSITRTLPTVLLVHRGYVNKIYMGNIPDPHQTVATYNKDSLTGNRILQLFSRLRSLSSIE
ncbi:MauE/DoxX family redox-associated membrane protein [Spirosoma panaciterrae]|uniref:MauE/DoxX family redox-associated membrane protein n=1 Tax=Spirosoma panaciterrae TaxID=496058 RepID=UPI00037FDEC5|nr:MauE/DoxX family redox-associated membrane protein [Spirosoma panaciterrae]